MLGILILLQSYVPGQSKDEIKNYFKIAGEEFGVPSEILEAIAFVNTRWTHIEPEKFAPPCDGRPPVYGIMGLRDDDWFGHSLIEGAKLIGVPVEVVKRDVYQNIRAGASLLAKLSSERGLRKGIARLEDYKDVVAKFSGIPQPEIAQIFAYDVYKVLSTGFEGFGIKIEKKEIDMSIFPKDLFERAGLKVINPDEVNSEDYPPAIWDPSPNYSSRDTVRITRIVIHVTQGGFAGSVSWLKNPQAQASAHYVIRSSDGYIVQLVREKDKAWHARCWNSFTIGIEHEGYVEQPDVWFTPVMYLESAKLVQNMVKRWAVPVDSNHIIGHNFWQQPQWPIVRQDWDFARYDPASTYPKSCNDHTDPGPGWNWRYYLSLIRSNQEPPKVIAVTPESGSRNFKAYKSVKIEFSLPMDKSSVESNLVINPADTVTLIWSSDQRVLEIKPNKFWEFSTHYTIKIDTGAKSVFGLGIDGDGNGVPGDPYYVEFTTTEPDLSPPVVEKGYPSGENISIYAEMKFVFDEPIESASLAGRVRLLDENDQIISITGGKHVIKDDKSIVTFKPSSTLSNGKIYKVKFLAGLKDLFGNATQQDYVFTFRTELGTFYQGTLVDSFETSSSWWKPTQSGSTVGVDVGATDFVITSEKKRSGSNSGKLTYKFVNESGGVVRVYNPSKPTVSDAQGDIGLWVYGDLSGNQLELWFYNPNNYVVTLGQIDWYGWKFVSCPISSIPGTSKQFHSIVVRQVSGADKEGELYFDDLQVGGKITSVASDEFPIEFSLKQNYPNPFNPGTTIEFDVPERSHVKLRIYDVLGREVKTLVDEELSPGRYFVKFYADDLPSGVYFYRLETGKFIAVRKMILVK